MVFAAIEFFVRQPENEARASLWPKIDHANKNSFQNAQNDARSHIQKVMSPHEESGQTNRGGPSEQRRSKNDGNWPKIEEKINNQGGTRRVTGRKRIFVRTHAKRVSIFRRAPSSCYRFQQSDYYDVQ